MKDNNILGFETSEELENALQDARNNKKGYSLSASFGNKGYENICLKTIDSSEIIDLSKLFDDIMNNNSINDMDIDIFVEYVDKALCLGNKKDALNVFLEGMKAKALKRKLATRKPLPNIIDYAALNDNVNNRMKASLMELDGQATLDVFQGKDITSVIALKYTGENLSIHKKLSGLDFAVIDAITTLYTAILFPRGYSMNKNLTDKHLVFSAVEICKCIYTKERVRENQIKAVAESIEKMSDTRMDIDVTQELNSHYKLDLMGDHIVEGHIEGRLIDCRKASFKTSKGLTVQGYEFLSLPLIAIYNLCKGHIIKIPYEILKLDNISIAENVIEFRDYLARQLALIDLGKRNNCVFKLATIYEESGAVFPSDKKTPSAQKTAAENDRKKIVDILTNWKNKGFIADFSMIHEGKSHKLTGFKIEPIKGKFVPDKALQ